MQANRIPRALAERLGHQATDGLVEILANTKASWTEDVLNIAVERFERRLTTELSALRVDVARQLYESLGEVRQEIASLRVELLKWSSLFWVGQVAAMAGLFAYMLRGVGR